MFWDKKKADPPKSADMAKLPLSELAAQAQRVARLSWSPPPEADRMMTMQELPRMLLAHANVTREQLQTAIRIQRQTGDFIGEILVNEGALDENSLVAFLAKYCKIPHLSLLDYLIDAKLFELVSPAFCQQHKLIPIDKMGRNLTVAMVNPLDSRALESLQESCPDLRIKPILCTTKHFDAVTKRLFPRKQVQEDAAMPGPDGVSPREKQPRETEKPPESVPPKGVDLDAVDMSDSGGEQLPLDAPMAEEGELPFAMNYDHPADHCGQPTEVEENRNALLESVFSLTSDGIEGDSGEGEEQDDNVIVGDMTRKMTTAMVKSMRNTYDVLARRVSLFRGIGPEVVAKLFARGKTVEYDAGQTVFQKGESGEYMYVILSGAVDIVDDDRPLAHLERGEIFGEMALMSNAARSATVRTVTATSLLMLSFADITQNLDSTTSVQLLVNITVTLSSRLRAAQSL